jgi:hypothetical protein
VPAKGPNQAEAQAPSHIEDGGAMGEEREAVGESGGTVWSKHDYN